MNKYIFAFIVLFVSTFINAIYASGGVMSTGGFSFDQNDILSARSIAISIVAIIIIVLLLKTFISWLKAWDKRCYEEDPTAIPNIDKEMSDSVKILISAIFTILTIISRGEFILFALFLIFFVFIVNLIIRFTFYILGLKSATVKNFVNGSFKLLIIIGIFAIIIMSMPTGRVSRWPARQKACYCNIRAIHGAVEMYNMDSPKMMKDLKMQHLTMGGYLKPGVKCPEANSDIYRAFGDLSKDGEVGCGNEAIGGSINEFKKYHGTLNGKSKYE